jgi:regulator of replication initiation timing
MIKTILTLITKVLESRLKKSGIEELILQNQNYITVAKQIWNTVEENFRIAEKVEDKLKSKVDEFDKMLLAKFPELSQDDITALRQSIAGEVNKDKQAVVDNSTLLQQLQESNTQLQAENASLKDQLSKVKTLISVATTNNQTSGTQTVQDNNQAAAGNNIAQPVQA